jgi:putative Holliday junction resolvase
MGRILAIDYGQKRVGVAVTDQNRIIATSLGTWHVKDFMAFLKDYCQKEEVDIMVVGQPLDMKSNDSDSARFVEPFVKHLRKSFPDKIIERMDERFTSKMAFQTLIDSGLKKKARQDKALVDQVSATIILQSYMEKLAFGN